MHSCNLGKKKQKPEAQFSTLTDMDYEHKHIQLLLISVHFYSTDGIKYKLSSRLIMTWQISGCWFTSYSSLISKPADKSYHSVHFQPTLYNSPIINNGENINYKTIFKMITVFFSFEECTSTRACLVG